jgi:hypothetical protein
MENVRHYRAMGSLCRQLAVFDPIHSWKYLIEAQKWEHRAEAEIASHFKECNTAGSSDPARSTTTPGTNDTRLKTSAEASGLPDVNGNGSHRCAHSDDDRYGRAWMD